MINHHYPILHVPVTTNQAIHFLADFPSYVYIHLLRGLDDPGLAARNPGVTLRDWFFFPLEIPMKSSRFIVKARYFPRMLAKQYAMFIYHPRVITINICGINLPFPVMGGKNDIVLPPLKNPMISPFVIVKSRFPSIYSHDIPIDISNDVPSIMQGVCMYIYIYSHQWYPIAKHESFLKWGYPQSSSIKFSNFP